MAKTICLKGIRTGKHAERVLKILKTSLNLETTVVLKTLQRWLTFPRLLPRLRGVPSRHADIGKSKAFADEQRNCILS